MGLMDQLPPEILFHILEWTVIALYGNKNDLLQLRTTCKMFDEILKPFALRTLQLEFTRLNKSTRETNPLDDDALCRAGPVCRALYLDMMVVRDEGEVRFLSELFSHIGAMDDFTANLRHKFCMTETSFTEIDYRRQLGTMLEYAPNVEAVKLNLPFQLVYPRQYRAATIILGNSFEALVQRPEESRTLKTLVLENLSNISVVSLWRNPQDVKNIITVFSDLRHLFMSVRRNEEGQTHTISFRNRLWEMIGKAEKLESLCLVDLDAIEKSEVKVKVTSLLDASIEDWQSRCIPTITKPPKSVLPNLTFLELRQVEVMGCDLLSMFKYFVKSLRELYLDGVWLKAVHLPQNPHHSTCNLWIGLPNMRPQSDQRWIATYLRQIRSRLRVCRVANLGYDQFILNALYQLSGSGPKFDLADPCDLSRTLEQRFVEVAMGIEQPPAPDGSPVVYLPEEPLQDAWALADRSRTENPLKLEDWDARYYLATHPSPTSSWQHSIDGQFPNGNQFTLNTLQGFAENAYHGMALLNELSQLSEAADVEGSAEEEGGFVA
ncbi:uncharacterized protein F4822DRAFT_324649 [Hypoxylon trugodes]|uniref:uncharacterized protein n=1 Tax=Hypoxylon trugodes TaxID=326681 RepID=UPI00219F8699|nr:uncharacterized protein F4822DRAFT_324649 [Hypoxylon trugodes]KAI1386703.1 hypothetical protein F4822DRAFT_324649 [Hypoxylon trugodes]